MPDSSNNLNASVGMDTTGYKAGVPQIILSIIMGIINSLPQLITEAPQIIMALISGVIQAVPQLLSLGPKILTGLWNGLSKQNWGQIGSNIIKGIVDGFGNALQYIEQGVQKAGNAIVNGFKSLFGIHSPSTVMDAEIGTNLGLGVVNGIKRTTGLAAQAMQGLTSGNVNVGYTGQTSGGSLGAGSNSTTYNSYGAAQQVTQLIVGSKTIATVIQPNISTGMASASFRRRRSIGNAAA